MQSAVCLFFHLITCQNSHILNVFKLSKTYDSNECFYLMWLLGNLNFKSHPWLVVYLSTVTFSIIFSIREIILSVCSVFTCLPDWRASPLCPAPTPGAEPASLLFTAVCLAPGRC